MLKSNKKLISLILGAAMLGGFYKPLNVLAVENVQKNRIEGEDRIKTAINISKNYWTSSKNVILARGDDFADALCAAPLAKIYDSPILLTDKENLREDVLEELKRLGAENIYIIGGEGAVSRELENELKEKVTKAIERISGKDRYETSVEIAKRINPNGKVVISTGANFADALSIASPAAAAGMPILLTDANFMPESVEGYLKDKKIDKAYVLGGESIVSKKVTDKILSIERLYGDTRYDTNLAVLKEFSGILNYDKVFVAVGENFPDALAGSAAAAKNKSPLVLVGNELKRDVKTYINDKLGKGSNVIALGGENAVKNSEISQLSINTTPYDKDGFTYGGSDSAKLEEIKGNIGLQGKNSKLNNAKIDGDLYIYGNNIEINNVEVKGSIYIDPGENGDVVLKAVKADKIILKSGSSSGIHLKDIATKKLLCESKNSKEVARVVLEGSSQIESTEVLTNVALQLISGEFGVINIQNNYGYDRKVEFKGNFEKEINVLGEVNLKFADNSSAVKVIVASDKADNVKVKGTIKQLDMQKEANVKILEGSKIDIVTNTTKSKDVVIDVAKGAEVKEAVDTISVTGENKGNVKIVKDDKKTETTPTTSSGSGSSSGGSTGGKDDSSTSYDALEDNYCKINVKSSKVIIKCKATERNLGRVAITVYDTKTKSLQFIGEAELKNGECNFNTQLDAKEYEYEIMGLKSNNEVITNKFTIR